jgi:dTDP-glucose pyrophosphorylase
MISKAQWEKALLSSGSAIEDAIKVLSNASLKIVLVTDSTLGLMGTITDGDIRRGLLRGLTLSSPISEIINLKPIVVPKTFTREVVKNIMSANRIFQIPIVDDDLTLIGLHVWDEQLTTVARDNVMVIMAGGRGTRLLPKTEKTPKPMLLLGGKPILEHIINRAKAAGIMEFVLAIHHLGDVIEEYFGNGQFLGVNISYLKEKSPLGTAGALGLIDPKPTNPIIVANGDVITDIRFGDILEFHSQNNAIATMAVQVHESENPFGVVQTKGIFITGYEEKPITRSLVNAGVYVLNPSALDYLEKDTECSMPTLFEILRAESLNIIAFPLHENWLDLGSPSDLAKAIEEIQFTKRQESNSND